MQGGFGMLEMCVNSVHYYPQTQLELYKIAVDAGFLRKYFHLISGEGSLYKLPACREPGHTTSGPVR